MSVGPAYDAFNDTEARLEAIRRALPPNPGRALDLGAGTGWLSQELAARGWEVIAVESNKAAAKRCRARGVTVVNKTLTYAGLLELMAHPWDLIAAMNFLHHTNDPRAFITELLGSTINTVLMQTPDRIEHGNQAVAGSHYLAILYDLALARGPSVLDWFPTNLDARARRPILIWDAGIIIGTVVSGHGYSTTQWEEVGAVVAAELGLEAHTGTLNLELDKALDDEELTDLADTKWGMVRGVEVLAGGVPAWALRMPNSDRGPMFTELLSATHMREALELENGARVPLRLKAGG